MLILRNSGSLLKTRVTAPSRIMDCISFGAAAVGWGVSPAFRWPLAFFIAAFVWAKPAGIGRISGKQRQTTSTNEFSVLDFFRLKIEMLLTTVAGGSFTLPRLDDKPFWLARVTQTK